MSDQPSKHKCPNCSKPLKEVPRHSKWLNDDQYEASKAGDWFCENCPDNGRGNSGLCYFWDREVEASERAACEAITHT